MTDYAAVLRELMLAGYEGAPLLAAFDRLCAAIAGRNLQIVHAGPATKPANMNKADNPVRVEAATPRPAPVVAVPPPENAKAIARKALTQSMLAPSTIAVGSQLVEHFNLTTGRCDPGTGSLAASCGVSIRTVRRAVSDLVKHGLFGRVRHGGHHHKNAYQPNWPVLVARAAEGDLTRTTLAADPAKSVTQNHLQKPDSDSMMGKAPRRRARPPDRRQVEMIMPIGGGREKSEEAVRAKLFRELDAHLRATFLPMDKAGFANGLTRSVELGDTSWQAAIKAEMRKQGDGLSELLQAIDALGKVRMGLGGSGR